MGGKVTTCEGLYMFPVCAQTICFCLVWPLTLLLLLSLAVTATLATTTTLSPLCHCLLAPLLSLPSPGALLRYNRQEGLPHHRPPMPSS